MNTWTGTHGFDAPHGATVLADTLDDVTGWMGNMDGDPAFEVEEFALEAARVREGERYS